MRRLVEVDHRAGDLPAELEVLRLLESVSVLDLNNGKGQSKVCIYIINNSDFFDLKQKTSIKRYYIYDGASASGLHASKN